MRTPDVSGEQTGAVQGGPWDMIASRSDSAFWGRTAASSAAGGMTAVVSTWAASSKSLFTLAVETQESASAVSPMAPWCVSTISETSSGGFARFSTIGSWSYGGSYQVVLMWSLANPRRHT